MKISSFKQTDVILSLRGAKLLWSMKALWDPMLLPFFFCRSLRPATVYLDLRQAWAKGQQSYWVFNSSLPLYLIFSHHYGPGSQRSGSAEPARGSAPISSLLCFNQGHGHHSLHFHLLDFYKLYRHFLKNVPPMESIHVGGRLFQSGRQLGSGVDQGPEGNSYA